jgi:hypothetical protein
MDRWSATSERASSGQVSQNFLGHLKQRNQLSPTLGGDVDLRLQDLQVRLIFSGK